MFLKLLLVHSYFLKENKWGKIIFAITEASQKQCICALPVKLLESSVEIGFKLNVYISLHF